MAVIKTDTVTKLDQQHYLKLVKLTMNFNEVRHLQLEQSMRELVLPDMAVATKLAFSGPCAFVLDVEQMIVRASRLKELELMENDYLLAIGSFPVESAIAWMKASDTVRCDLELLCGNSLNRDTFDVVADERPVNQAVHQVTNYFLEIVTNIVNAFKNGRMEEWSD